jgi:hypothetical protein
VSEGTIKVHLHNVYDKLAIRNRTMLASLCADRVASGGRDGQAPRGSFCCFGKNPGATRGCRSEGYVGMRGAIRASGDRTNPAVELLVERLVVLE